MDIYTVTMEFRIEAEDIKEAEEKLGFFKEGIQDIQWNWLPLGTVEFLKSELYFHSKLKELDWFENEAEEEEIEV